MPLNHSDLASVFARAVELGSNLRALELASKRPPPPPDPLVRVGGLRGVLLACDKLRQSLTPGAEATVKERAEAIEKGDCSPAALTALLRLNYQLDRLRREADQAAAGRGPNFDTLKSYLAESARLLWAALSGREKDAAEHMRAQAQRIWDWLDWPPAAPAGAPPVQTPPPDPAAELTALERAIALYLRNPALSVKEVARQAGCDRSLLYHDERFKRLRQCYQGKPPPRGTKSKEGDLEAEEED